MILDAQVLLGPAVVALYLKDCLWMLHRDEAVLVRGWRGRWRAGFGARHWRLAGREPYLCHPLLPHEAVMRLRWDAARRAPDASASRAEPPAELAALAPWSLSIWCALFIFLPAAFYGHLGLPTLLADLAVLYALIVGSLCVVHRRRVALGLRGRDFGILAFELLACAPYAANLVRRLCAHQRVDEDFVAAAARLVEGEGLARARDGCRARLDDELDALDETSPRAAALRQARARFASDDNGRVHGGQ